VLFIERILAIVLEVRPGRAQIVPGWPQEDPVFSRCLGIPCTVVLEPVYEQPGQPLNWEISSPAAAPRRFSTLPIVMVPKPDARLVAPLGGAVEPLVHGPEAVQSAP